MYASIAQGSPQQCVITILQGIKPNFTKKRTQVNVLYKNNDTEANQQITAIITTTNMPLSPRFLNKTP